MRALLILAALLIATNAAANPVAPSSCLTDVDCPGPQCGGFVCNWNAMSPVSLPDKPYLCNPAGTSPKGKDGWCITDQDCKCRGLGARCMGVYCSFTQASDAPAGAGGAPSSGGTASSGSSTAGSVSHAGSAGARGPGPIAEPEGTSDGEHLSKACAVATPGLGAPAWNKWALLAAFGAAVARRRGRRGIYPR